MKIQDLKNRAPEELARLLKEQKEALHKLRLDIIAGKAKNTGQFKIARRTIARILTLLKQQPKQQ